MNKIFPLLGEIEKDDKSHWNYFLPKDYTKK